MAAKIYKFVKGSTGFNGTLPSGLDSLTGVTAMSITIKSRGATVTKSLTGSNIVSGTTNVNVPFSGTDLDTEGLHDYEVTNTTSGASQKGKLLQFTVTKSIN